MADVTISIIVDESAKKAVDSWVGSFQEWLQALANSKAEACLERCFEEISDKQASKTAAVEILSTIAGAPLKTKAERDAEDKKPK